MIIVKIIITIKIIKINNNNNDNNNNSNIQFVECFIYQNLIFKSTLQGKAKIKNDVI